jgi:hypothetical protein
MPTALRAVTMSPTVYFVPEPTPSHEEPDTAAVPVPAVNRLAEPDAARAAVVQFTPARLMARRWEPPVSKLMTPLCSSLWI